MQDNMSAIGIINNGGSFSRSKHMMARYSFVKHMELGAHHLHITFKHYPGEVMSADADEAVGRNQTKKAK